MTPTTSLRRLLARIEAASNGYLVQVGWPLTRATHRATDAQGQPIPWFTYPAVEFLKTRVRPDWRVLEYGCGAGTLWWSRNCGAVVAIEHDQRWAEDVASKCTASILRADDGDARGYVDPPGLAGAAPFDVIVVDGIFRPDCLAACTRRLSDRGIVIVDDAQRPEYEKAIGALLAEGFRAIPFHGPQPVSKHPGCTLVLYRDGNVLGV